MMGGFSPKPHAHGHRRVVVSRIPHQIVVYYCVVGRAVEAPEGIRDLTVV